MRFTESDPAVDEERVVGSGRQLGNCMTRGLGELVRIPNDERIERVASGKTRGSRRRCVAGHARSGPRSVRFALDLEGDARSPTENLARGGLKEYRMIVDEPVARVLVGCCDANVVAVHRDQMTGLEPRVER